MLLSLFFCILQCPTSLADVPATPPPAKHYIRIEGMDQHPDFALVIFDKNGKGKSVQSLGSFTAKRSKDVLIVDDNAPLRPRFGEPEVWLMSLTDHQAWTVQLSTQIIKQRQDCLNGIGCKDISSFRPSFQAPTKIIPCNVEITPIRVSTHKGAIKTIDTFQIKELSATNCKLHKKKQDVQQNNQEQASKSSFGCSSLPSHSNWLVAILAFCCMRRRNSITTFT